MSRPVFNRSDTMLGVCEAVGQDLGFHPNWLRVAFAVGVFWSLPAAVATYLALGVAVAVARALTPARAAAAKVASEPAADNDDEGRILLAEAA